MPPEPRILTLSWVLLLLVGLGILGFGVAVAVYPPIAGPAANGVWRTVGVATAGMGLFGVAITVWGYRQGARWAWAVLWYYPVFWTVHLVTGLPPGTDHLHQLAFIVLSLVGLLLPVRAFFPRRPTDAGRR